MGVRILFVMEWSPVSTAEEAEMATVGQSATGRGGKQGSR
jgi:hypothetical protein